MITEWGEFLFLLAYAGVAVDLRKRCWYVYTLGLRIRFCPVREKCLSHQNETTTLPLKAPVGYRVPGSHFLHGRMEKGVGLEEEEKTKRGGGGTRHSLASYSSRFDAFWLINGPSLPPCSVAVRLGLARRDNRERGPLLPPLPPLI